MANFIAYQPRVNAPSFRNRVFGKSSAIGLHSQLSTRNTSNYPQQERPASNTGFVVLVDLTTSDHYSAREYPVEREILEPTAHGPDRRGIRATRARNNDVTDSDGIEDNSETSDLPSPTDLFLRSDSGFEESAGLSKASASLILIDRTDEKYWHEGDCEDHAGLTAITAAGIELEASQGE